VQTLTRKSVPLDEDLVGLVAALRLPESPERVALESITDPLPADLSEAQVLNRLLVLGANGIRDVMMYASYLDDAANLTKEDLEYQKWSRARRVERDRAA